MMLLALPKRRVKLRGMKLSTSLGSEYQTRIDAACYLYCMRVLEQKTVILARICLGVSSVFHLGMGPLDYFYGIPFLRLKLTFFHFAMLILSLLLNFFYHRLSRVNLDVRILYNLYSVLGIFCYTAIAREVIHLEPYLIPRYSLIFVLVSFFIVIFNPCLRGVMRYTIDFCAIASIIFAFGEADDGVIICIIVSLLVSNTLGLRVLFWRFVKKDLEKDFERQCTLAPQHMILRASEQQIDLGKMLAPKERVTCCISTDWQNYTSFSSNKNPTELVNILRSYYDSCLVLLDTLLPDSIYFIDWIADELFIAIVADSPEEERQLVNRGLNLAYQLLMLKEKFFESYGAPAAIDVGVSFGSSYAGIIGPKSSQKATAIGEIPFRARRLQTSGKLLRQELGEVDRVIFGRETLMKVSESWNINAFEILRTHHLRDLPDRELFYLDKIARSIKGEPSSTGQLSDKDGLLKLKAG